MQGTELVQGSLRRFVSPQFTGGFIGKALLPLKQGMRNSLQYAYSIVIFCGVLVSAYLMMSSETNARIPMRSFQSPTYRPESASVDPALNQLFEVESALSNMPGRSKAELSKRVPAKSVSRED